MNYADLFHLPEDERIDVMGKMVEKSKPGTIIGVMVDAEPEDAKAKRYVEKLTKRYKVRVIDIGPGLTKSMTLIRLTQRGDA